MIKGIVHPKMNILSSHPQVFPNLYQCLCSAEHKGRYFEESWFIEFMSQPMSKAKPTPLEIVKVLFKIYLKIKYGSNWHKYNRTRVKCPNTVSAAINCAFILYPYTAFAVHVLIYLPLSLWLINVRPSAYKITPEHWRTGVWKQGLSYEVCCFDHIE